jgi:hypothetical protein
MKSLWDLLDIDIQDKIISIKNDILEYDKCLLKVSNFEIVQYIQTYMIRTENVRITNISGMKKPELFEIIKKFNIPNIPYDIVMKKEINKNIKVSYVFKTGNYILDEKRKYSILIQKITKCYIWVEIFDLLNPKLIFNGKVWKNIGDNYEYITPNGEPAISSADLVQV